MLTGTGNFGFLAFAELRFFQRAFGFRYEIDVLDVVAFTSLAKVLICILKYWLQRYKKHPNFQQNFCNNLQLADTH